METVNKAGFPILGVIFLGLAVLKMVQGGDWVVWAILGVLFGGLAAFRVKKRGAE